MDPQRQIPPFATRRFRAQIPTSTPDLGGARGSRRRVVLFADTFTESFVPSQGLAAFRVLRAAGYDVEVPRADLCCGRPLYDWGFVGQARRLLRRMLGAFEPELESGVPIVFLEPSCGATMRDELVNLFPRDARARRLAGQTFLLAEFVNEHSADFEGLFGRLGGRLGQEPAGGRLGGEPSRQVDRRPGTQVRRRLDGPAGGRLGEEPTGQVDVGPGGSAILHGHCHQKAVAGMAAEVAVLRSVGLDPRQPEPGCCGMAGAFGFERGEHYELARRIGDRALLPAVREAPEYSLVIADGFSCRQQIEQSTGRHVLHLAEVLAAALEGE